MVIAILAFGFLGLGVAQAITLGLHQLILKKPGRIQSLNWLPPIQTMESVLFQMVGLGFILLTITLITGTLFSEELFGKLLVFNHHILLSIIAWCIYGTFLIGKLCFGWRGTFAIKLNVAAFTILLLAYFGSRFVTEVLIS